MTGRRLNSAVELRVKRPDGGTFRRFSHMVSRNAEISFPPRIVTNFLTFFDRKKSENSLANSQHSAALSKVHNTFQRISQSPFENIPSDARSKVHQWFQCQTILWRTLFANSEIEVEKNSPLELENVNIINCFTSRQRHDVMCAERWMSSLQRCEWWNEAKYLCKVECYVCNIVRERNPIIARLSS